MRFIVMDCTVGKEAKFDKAVVMKPMGHLALLDENGLELLPMDRYKAKQTDRGQKCKGAQMDFKIKERESFNTVYLGNVVMFGDGKIAEVSDPHNIRYIDLERYKPVPATFM